MVKMFDTDDTVSFVEDTHQYFAGDIELISTTRVISKVKMPFDAKGISLRMAKGDPVKQKEILDSWEEKKNSSLDRGNWIHDNLEAYLLFGDYDNALKGVVNQLKPIIKAAYRFFPEALLYNMKYKVAGQSDLVVQRQLGPNSVFDFYDYKTNESKGIEFDSVDRRKDPVRHYNRFMLDPLTHLEDCNYNQYALQLSIYATLANMTWGIRIGRLAILFIDLDLKMHMIPVPFMKYEALALLDHYASLKPLPTNDEPDDDW